MTRVYLILVSLLTTLTSSASTLSLSSENAMSATKAAYERLNREGYSTEQRRGSTENFGLQLRSVQHQDSNTYVLKFDNPAPEMCKKVEVKIIVTSPEYFNSGEVLGKSKAEILSVSDCLLENVRKTE